MVIPTNETRLFEELIGIIGSDFLEPRLIDFDSGVVKNLSDQILLVYKPNDAGRNIYTIEENWLVREPSKRSFRYEFEIKEEDLE